MKNTIRAFIAVEINESLQNGLLHAQGILRQSGADVKWTEPNNIHLTLKFLEDIPASNVGVIGEIMAKAVQGIRPFPIDITELNAFPDILFPKIIWAGVTKNADLLSRIVTNLDAGLTPLKIKKEERQFAAHITLGRTRSFIGKDKLSASLEETNLPSGLTQTVNHLSLIQSALTPKGPVYTTVQKVSL